MARPTLKITVQFDTLHAKDAPLSHSQMVFEWAGFLGTFCSQLSEHLFC